MRLGPTALILALMLSALVMAGCFTFGSIPQDETSVEVPAVSKRVSSPAPSEPQKKPRVWNTPLLNIKDRWSIFFFIP